MAKPQNKEEFRRQMAEEFANVLEEKGLEWKQEWSVSNMAQQNGITHGAYRGVNAFWLKLVSMSQHYTDPRLSNHLFI